MRNIFLTLVLGLSIVTGTAHANDAPLDATIVVRNDMPVVSSDGARVAVVNHVPVFYTHLDVYKRQILRNTGWRNGSNDELRSTLLSVDSNTALLTAGHAMLRIG